MSRPALADGPLHGLRVLDMSRILAGPTCAQLLGDLGAEIVKIERPGMGDDTRGWGPPFVRDADGRETRESAYYLCANRNKRSVAVDIASEQGAAVIRRLAARSDVLLENFKLGDLDRRGLGYAALSRDNPGLVYCSITGFGRTGPYAGRAGYDFLAQGFGGIMSVTGEPAAEGGRPMKVGVGIADVMCGMYASVAVLAALRARETSGRGQHIDLSLLDTQMAWLINQGAAYLTDGQVPERLGNAHPSIAPYDTFPASDGWFIIAAGNDAQFRRLCEAGGHPELAQDARFCVNVDRVRNRDALTPLVREMTRRRDKGWWIATLEQAGVPCGPVNDIAEAFADPQAAHRGARLSMAHPAAGAGAVELIANPIRYSETPVTYRHAPPMLGQHSAEVLTEAGFTAAEITELATAGVIGGVIG